MRARSTGSEAALAHRILIVEDDADLARLYADALAADGFEARVERTPAAALEAFRAHVPDLVVLDVLLPHGIGFEVAEELRRLPGGDRCPLLFVSGIYKAARHRADAMEQLGAVDFLEKPLGTGEFVGHVRRALGASETTHSAPLRGELADRPFFRVLAELATARATGLVHLRREKLKKVVALRDGVPVSVKSNLLSECLGRVMIGLGLIDEAQCEASLEAMKQTGHLQGRVLVDAGVVTPVALAYALQAQLEQKLFDVFGWPSGEWQFAPASVPAAEVGLDMAPARILYEGLVHAWNEARLSAALDELPSRVPRPAAGADDAVRGMAGGVEVEQAFALANGARSLEEIAAAGILPRANVLALGVALEALGQVALVLPGDTEEALVPVRRSSPPENLTPPAAPLTPPDHALLERLEAHLADLARRTHYEVLGVPPAASSEEIRRAWRSLARDHHPDKHYSNAPAPVRAAAERVFDRITAAQDVLLDADERGRYDASVADAPEEGDAERAARILQADEAFRAGRAALGADRPREALGSLARAVALYPEEAAFHAYLGLATHLAAPGDRAAAADALAHLARAAERQADLVELRQFDALVRLALGEQASVHPARAGAEPGG